MSKGLKRTLCISLVCVLIAVGTICCLSACDGAMKIKAYIDDESVSFANTAELVNTVPQKEGYTFDGWVYYVDNAPKKVTKDTVPTDKSIIYYATWTAVEYTVTFYVDGTAVGTDTYSAEKQPTMPTIPQKQGYSAAWEQHEFTTGDVDINAVYTPLTYDIAYENLYGAANPNVSAYLYGKEYTFVKPERVGYTFNGWRDREGNAIEKIEKGCIGDVIVCADWTPIPFTITYTNTKGAALGEIPTSYTVESAGFALPTLSAQGYTFDGWYNVDTKVDKIERGTMGNIILDAHWTPIVYTITYNNTKGRGVEPCEYTIDSPTIRLTAIAAEGYTFTGWYDGDTKVESIPLGSMGNLTLTAHWTAEVYTVTYTNTKGATHTNPTQYTIESNGVALSAIQADGYTFDGWYRQNRKVDSISADILGNLTFEARWTPIAYSITYYNAQDCTNPNPTAYTVESGKIVLSDAAKDWYVFNGWYADASLTQRVTELDTTSMQNISLYAGWNLAQYNAYYYVDTTLVHTQPFNVGSTEWTAPAVPEKQGYSGHWRKFDITPGDINVFAYYSPYTYTISYLDTKDAQNGNPIGYTPEFATFELSPLTAPGYTFLGWYDQDQLVTEIAKGSFGDRELTAHWEIAVYSISYENTKTAEVADLVDSYTIESDAIELPADLSVTGYTFDGWSNQNGETIERIEKGSFGDLVLTAIFTPIQYAIEYQNVGTAVNPNQSTYTIESGMVLQPLARDGYDFLGWYSGDDAVAEITVGEYGDCTLQAKWDIATYHIIYNNTKDADTGAFVNEFTIESQTILLPAELSVAGYVFNGWKDADGNKVQTIEQGHIGDVELTADLTPIVYNIAYKNTNEAINLNPQSYTAEDSITLNPLQRKGYAFVGWYQDGNLVSAVNSGTVGDITLIAKWELAVYTITYTGTYGADTSNFVSSYTIETDSFALPVDVKVSGYTFNGWKNESGSLVTQIRKGSYGDLVLTADLLPTKYVITLEAMDGTVGKTSVAVLHGQDYTLPVPTYANGTFLGWYNNTGSDATRMTDENGNSINAYPYRSARTFYAHYDVDVFTVTFDADGGTSIPAQQYTSGSLFVESAAYTERGNDLFQGWYDAQGTKFTDGTPITASVVLKAKWAESIAIADIAGLLAIAQDPTANYHLVNDINLKGNIWTPIETFSGVLDGKGYTLKNFNLSCTSQASRFAFINVNNGTVKNLCLGDFTYNVSLGAFDHLTAALFVAENNGSVENCVVNSGLIKLNLVDEYAGTITLNKKFGTFVGQNAENASVKNCRSTLGITITVRTVNTYGDWYDFVNRHNLYFGGIAADNLGIVDNCNYQATFNISTYASGGAYHGEKRGENHTYFGGIVGRNEVGAVCQNSYTNAELIAQTSNGNYGYNYLYVGGLVGVNAGDITSCHAAGTISDGTYYVGGLVGQNLDKANVVSCYSTVDIALTKGGNFGGFVGVNEGIIQNSYAKGNVSTTANGNIAGFVGENRSTGSITKCYSNNGNVSAVSGNVGYFAASSTGTLFKCFYLSSSTLMLNGEEREYFTEYDTVNGLLNQTLWSKEFLVEELYWEEEGWIILSNENPVLNWEISIDDYDVTVIEPDCENMGYSVYEEKAGNRFFIRNYVAAWGHSYDEYNVTVVAPTCATQGYEEYTCMICNHVERMNYTDALGHIAGDVIDHKDPTCTEDGYTVRNCAVCGKAELRTQLPALGHTPVVTVERVNPTCYYDADSGEFVSTVGQSERIECSVCYDPNNPDKHFVIQEPTEIQPHNFELTVTTTEPTCTENGLGTYTCRYENCGYFEEKVIPALGHKDDNGDHICDVCHILLGIYEGETIVEIKTAADLLGIKNNLNGVYRLMNDIDMKDTTWTPVGSKDRPFTGYFDGNGHAIKNLGGANQSVVAMFGYTRGIVHGLTLNYESGVTADLSSNGTGGLLAEYNDGLIIACEIAGIVNVNFSYVSSSGEFKDTNQSATATFGGIVYTNGANGMITDSTVSATFHVTYEHKYTLTTNWSANVLLNRSYVYRHTSIFNVYFGIIAGDNNGTIQACTAAGAVQYRAGNEGAATAKVKDSNGHVYVTTNVHIESFAAIGNGSIANCSTMLNATGVPTTNALRYFAKFWTEEETFNLTIDSKKYANQ